MDLRHRNQSAVRHRIALAEGPQLEAMFAVCQSVAIIQRLSAAPHWSPAIHERPLDFTIYDDLSQSAIGANFADDPHLIPVEAKRTGSLITDHGRVGIGSFDDHGSGPIAPDGDDAVSG